MLQEVQVEYELPTGVDAAVLEQLPKTLPLALLHPGLVLRLMHRESVGSLGAHYSRTRFFTVDRVHLAENSTCPMTGSNWGVILVLSGGIR